MQNIGLFGSIFCDFGVFSSSDATGEPNQVVYIQKIHKGNPTTIQLVYDTSCLGEYTVQLEGLPQFPELDGMIVHINLTSSTRSSFSFTVPVDTSNNKSKYITGGCVRQLTTSNTFQFVH